MAKFAIFVCLVLALGYGLVRSQETLTSLEQKIITVEVKAESDVGDAKEKVADALEELKQRAAVARTMGYNGIMDALNQVEEKFNRLKAKAHGKNINRCLYLQTNLRNSGLLTISDINMCTNDRVDEGYQHVEKVNRYEHQAQMGVRNLREKFHRCKTHPSPACLNNVKEAYHTVSTIRVPEVLRNIESEQLLIKNITVKVMDCLTTNGVHNIHHRAQPALAEFERCVRNA